MKPASKVSKIWDVIVIGGGPSGMMAAGTAAKNEASVLLIEKNPALGKKLLITGGGRCNLTNAELDNRKLLAKFGEASKFLFSAFSQWNVRDTLDFFHQRGLETKIENELRVFPVSDRASSVWDVLVNYMKEGKVTIMTDSPVKNLIKSKEGLIKAVKLVNGDTITGKTFVVATGGKSHPETGSTGDGFDWLKSLGHKVIEDAPALVPIKLKDPWIKKLQGVSLPMVKLSIFQNLDKKSTHKGKLLFTHFGVSGPTILNMSHEVSELLEYEPVTIIADLLPYMDHSQVDSSLQEIFRSQSNKKFRNIINAFLPSALMQTLGVLAEISLETPCHNISRKERLRLVQLLKALPLHVSGILGREKAIVTSGGVDLKEVDFKTMRSRIVGNLYLTGDILNIVRHSGGYSLQLCWTTGAVAGKYTHPPFSSPE